MADTTVWGIHAGGQGQAESIFLKEKFIAIGWDAIGDLQRWSDKEALKSAIRAEYPDTKAGAVPVYAGVLTRFAQEMQPGHLVVYPCKSSHEIWVGRIAGAYEYDGSASLYRHRRKVEWLQHAPRLNFTQGALYEVGSAVTLFIVKNYADEFIALAEGTALLPTPDDDTVALVTRDIEQQTRDFILRQLATQLKGHPFAHFVADILRALGYQTQVSPPGPDHGIDIIAHPDELGFQTPRVKVQVKSTSDGIGEPEVSQLYGKVDNGEFGLFVTLGTFRTPAANFARSKSNLRLLDGDQLVDLILAHYEDLDPRYKSHIPLRKAYVPETLEADGQE
jgi:restriction system protein